MDTKFLKKALQIDKSAKDDIHISAIAGTIFGLFTLIAVLGAVFGDGRYSDAVLGTWVIGWMLAGIYILFALKVASQWEKAIVLRFGKFRKLAGPGLFWIIPIVETTPTWIDHRVMVSPFAAQKTLTKDTVPVDVDAVLFWVVWDAEKAALEVEDYRAADICHSPGGMGPERAFPFSARPVRPDRFASEAGMVPVRPFSAMHETKCA